MNDLSSWSFAGTERLPWCAGGRGDGQLRGAESAGRGQQSGSHSPPCRNNKPSVRELNWTSSALRFAVTPLSETC